MAKVLNVVFGVGIAVVIFILLLLGIQAFYPSPEFTDFCDESLMYDEPFEEFAKCPDNITVGECRASIGIEDIECQKEFMEASKAYNKNFFIIGSILGLIMIVVAFLLWSMPHISAGVAFSGIVLMVVSFVRGWQSTNDILKFIVGLVIAAIVIFLAVTLSKKLGK